MKFKTKKIIGLLILCLPALARENFQEQTIPTLDFGDRKVPVTSLCQEGNYVRTVRIKNLVYKKILSEEELDLGQGRIVTRVHEVPSSFTIMTSIGGKPFTIPFCQKPILNQEIDTNYVKKEATAQERLVLGALYQRGITRVKNQSPSFERLELINSRGGPTQSSIYFDLGGEGSGNGKVVADINIPLKNFSQLTLTPKRVFGLFSTKVPYEDYILDGQAIPSSIVGVNKR